MLDRAVSPPHGRRAHPKVRTTLVLQSDSAIFTAETDESQGEGTLSSIPLGSIVQVNGDLPH